jgi:hypothetical protein
MLKEEEPGKVYIFQINLETCAGSCELFGAAPYSEFAKANEK